MYRACRWTTSASRAIRDSTRKPEEKLFANCSRPRLEFRRNNAVAAAFKTAQLVRLIGSGVLAAGATIGIGIFYAGRDDKIRSEIEDKLPGSQTVLTAIYGDRKETNKDDEASSLLPLNKKLQELSTSLKQGESKAEDNALEDIVVAEERPRSRNDVVVITTIDDQAAVSSVDLDIGNATTVREKSTPKKPKKEKKAKEKKEKESKEEKNEAQTEATVGVEGKDKTLAVATGSELIEEMNKESVPQLDDAKDDATPADCELAPEITERSPLSEQVVDEAITVTTEAEPSQVDVIPPIDAEQVLTEDHLTKEEIGRISEMVDDTSMEVLIETYADKLQLLREMAVEKQAMAALQVREYIAQLDTALKMEPSEELFDGVWKATSELEHKSQALVNDAKSMELKMQSSIDELHEMIQTVKRKTESKIAEEAQEVINNASSELHRATAEIKKACDELAAFDKSTYIANAKQKIEGHVEETFSELYQEAKESADLPVKDVIMAYALKKIDHLKNAIESVKKEEKERTDVLLRLLREEEEARTQARLQSEAVRLEKNFEIEAEKKEAELTGYYENEIKKQLKRQAAAHNELLDDKLKSQSELLTSEHQKTLDNEISKQQAIHFDELSRVAAHLKGVESVIDSVVDAASKNREAKELWVAVQSLGSVLSEEAGNGRTRSLLPEMMSIHKLAENRPNVKLVLSTIPETAAVQGVNTEEELKKRFAGVKNICKRVAMVGDKEGSLWTYALSTIRSFLFIETAAKHDTVSDIDVESINTYDVLVKAQSCIENGDLELAVKFMSLLKGVPRKLASDWLRESRSYLEARLASDFLLAYVSSEYAFEN